MTVAFETRLLQAAERIAEALVGIRVVLDEMTLPQPDEPLCSHPLDRRISFGLTNGQPDWQCRDCGFRVSEFVEVPGHA